MPKITVTVRCASRDSFLSSQGLPSYFAAVLACLDRQTFTDFEVVWVDLHHKQNCDAFAAMAMTDYLVKHVDVHPQHRYWLDQGLAAMAAATNTAILYADANTELIISLDDAEFFDPDFLQRYWDHYHKDFHFMHAAHRRLHSIKHVCGLPEIPIAGDVFINDSRLPRVQEALRKTKKKVFHHTYGNWLCAGKSFTLQDALTLNGFNERIDGNCCLEDCEFGVRLELLGRKFVYDPDGCVYILDHPSYVDDAEGSIKLSRNFVAVETFGILRCAVELKDFEANRGHQLSDRHLAIIERETLKYRKFSIFADENKERLAIWKNTPTFDLRQQREELRCSSMWKW
jgi:hypothetical protein